MLYYHYSTNKGSVTIVFYMMPRIPKTEVRRKYKAKRQPKRGTSDQGFYNSPVWRKARRAFLDSHPNHSLCQVCLQKNELTPANVVDHIIPISAGGARLDDRNYMPMCHRCHNVKRGLESHGFVPDNKIWSNERTPTKTGIKQVFDKILKR